MPKVVVTLRTRFEIEPGEDKDEAAREFLIQARRFGVDWLLNRLVVAEVELEDPYGFAADDTDWKYGDFTGEE